MRAEQLIVQSNIAERLYLLMMNSFITHDELVHQIIHIKFFEHVFVKIVEIAMLLSHC